MYIKVEECFVTFDMVNSADACLIVSSVSSLSISSILCLMIFSIADRMTVRWPELNCNMYRAYIFLPQNLQQTEISVSSEKNSVKFIKNTIPKFQNEIKSYSASTNMTTVQITH